MDKIINEVTNRSNAGVQISNTSELNVMSFKWLSKWDWLRVVQHEYRTDTNGTNS